MRWGSKHSGAKRRKERSGSLSPDNPPRIIIADNGQGITPEQSENLFSPFYSTKVNGQGIGLTLTREVLHQHRASFSLETKASGWTECELVFLPGE